MKKKNVAAILDTESDVKGSDKTKGDKKNMKNKKNTGPGREKDNPLSGKVVVYTIASEVLGAWSKTNENPDVARHLDHAAQVSRGKKFATLYFPVERFGLMFGSCQDIYHAGRVRSRKIKAETFRRVSLRLKKALESAEASRSVFASPGDGEISDGRFFLVYNTQTNPVTNKTGDLCYSAEKGHVPATASDSWDADRYPDRETALSVASDLNRDPAANNQWKVKETNSGDVDAAHREHLSWVKTW